mgnify:CR=1 FL=1
MIDLTFISLKDIRLNYNKHKDYGLKRKDYEIL